MKLHYVAFACLLLGCSDRTAVGKVVDAMSEQPITDLRLVARAQAPADMSCQVLEATTDAAGEFLVQGACADIPYLFEAGDNTIFLAGAPGFTGGVPHDGVQTIQAWRAPPGDGVYVLKGSEIFAMRVASKVAELPLWKSTEKVLYPEAVPARLPKLGPTDHLIISGANTIQRMALHPLIKHDGPLRFGSKNHYFDMDAWSYIGRRFTSKEEHEAVAAQLDESKVIKLMERDRALKYVPGAALAPGVYAMLGEGDQRVYLLEVGG